MNADARITFVGGPLDGRVSQVRDLMSGTTPMPDGTPVNLKSMDARREPPMVRKGHYEAMVVHRRNGERVPLADELGNWLYRWTGWETRVG